MLAAAAAALAAAAPPPFDARQPALQAGLQAVLDQWPLTDGQVMQVGWKSESMAFSVQSGSYYPRGDRAAAPRAATAEDTFLYGSGSKPFTTAGVMSLVSQGVVSLDDPAELHLDRVIPLLRPTSACPTCPSTWAGMFPGTNGSKVTVGLMLQMRSGVKDYDDNAFDYMILNNRSFSVVNPLDFIDYVSKMEVPFDFVPGTHSAYSSTGFVLAGLVMLAHADELKSGRVGSWTGMRTDLFYQRPALRHTHFFTNESLSKYLTVPGMDGPSGKTIYTQNSSILGYTCANVVAPASEIAEFYWDLVGPAPAAVTPEQSRFMQQFHDLDRGWMSGMYKYGTGLMGMGNLSMTGGLIGHGGVSYGFNSLQGVVVGLNASISLVSNGGRPFDQAGADNPFCTLVQAAAQTLGVVPKAPQTCNGAPTTVQRYATGGACLISPRGSFKAACETGPDGAAVFREVVYPDGACAEAVIANYTRPAGQCLCAGPDAVRYECHGDAVEHQVWESPYLTCPGPQLPHVC